MTIPAYGQLVTQPANNLSAPQNDAPYIVYDVWTTWTWDSGAIPLVPSAGAGDSVGDVTEEALQFIQVSKPTATRTVHFSMVRVGLPPVPPDPTPQPGEVLLKGAFSAPTPVPSDSGSGLAFRLEGQYLYVGSKPQVAAIEQQALTALPD